MLKREHAQPSEGPLAKKHKDEVSSSGGPTMSGPSSGEIKKVEGASAAKERELANLQGLVLWQTIKDAVNKEDRTLSLEFMHKPSKKLYADYYLQIQRPVSLDDVKKKLDASGYPTFEAVRQDLELCFTNAKTYNQKNSQIWKDAKHLHKLVAKESARINPSEDDHVDVEGGGGSQGGGDDADERKKAKAPNMNRLLKSRLQKLVDKTDDSGRILSEVFMELPSKKDWPMYYKEIKRPQCIENIFKRLKRKEYLTSSDFAADVELVFSNAMQFNQDHSPIWEDAKMLREYFRQLMSDLPPPFAIPDYSKPTKIKLKVPAVGSASGSAPAPAPTSTPSIPQLPSSNSVTASGGLLKQASSGSFPQASDVRVKLPAAAPPVQPPATPPPTQVSSTSTPSAAPPVVVRSVATPAQTQQPPVSTPHVSQSITFSQHYPNAAYTPPVTALSVGATPAVPSPVPSIVNPLLARTLPARSVSPPHRLHHPLQEVSLKIEPRGRPLRLDHSDGVKSWAIKLGHGEKALVIINVSFLLGEEEESSADEEEEERKEEEEEEEHDVEADVPVKNGRKKGKGRGRGRPRGSGLKAAAAPAIVINVAEKSKVKKAKKTAPSMDDVQVKLDGTQVNAKEEGKGEWYVELPVGLHVVEVGAKGGMVWKVFAERMNE